ncbi:OLC1v1019993C1 [Oldenlandia corymbosa var. corymbosa]|uniref:OLC1v1019993C1 n=1 Tax=Oldenlandia corymbosa var. corymbosa TaxID=529605 RepID=A0AAV1EFF2_OLDCO|nr:OLC1v1019993C1 [Oldenlandia corymbosa var. corymbosa]
MSAKSLPTSLLLLTVLVTIFLTRSSTSQTTENCVRLVQSLVPCLDYVTGRSTEPTGNCCSAFGNAIYSSIAPSCLCQAFRDDTAGQYGVNTTLALSLPSQCHLNSTPLIGDCNDKTSLVGSSA